MLTHDCIVSVSAGYSLTRSWLSSLCDAEINNLHDHQLTLHLLFYYYLSFHSDYSVTALMQTRRGTRMRCGNTFVHVCLFRV